MDSNNVSSSFLKSGDTKIINAKYIRWVKNMGNCFEVCTKSNGCGSNGDGTHLICNLKNPESYAKLKKMFELTQN